MAKSTGQKARAKAKARTNTVEVTLDDDEHARFKRCAAAAGQSLASWLRDAGEARAARSEHEEQGKYLHRLLKKQMSLHDEEFSSDIEAAFAQFGAHYDDVPVTISTAVDRGIVYANAAAQHASGLELRLLRAQYGAGEHIRVDPDAVRLALSGEIVSALHAVVTFPDGRARLFRVTVITVVDSQGDRYALARWLPSSR